MRTLSLIAGLLAFVFVAANLATDSPHGKDFTIPCSQCHSAKGWFLDKEIYSFDHGGTRFPLAGQHQVAECRLCHLSLVFSEAKETCIACHTDMHNQTVGPDCGRCHTPDSWIVSNITEIHRMSRFPLVGPHYTSDCSSCHPSASLLRFEPQGVECVDCHLSDYQATTNPSHTQGNFSTNCSECHLMNAFTWTGSGINHEFFPLVQGHSIGNCQECHAGGSYSGLSPECSSCHMDNYNTTTNPNHITGSFPTTCSDCHSLNPGWKPAEFALHDAQYFPVYSGKHQGTWTSCADCHNSGGNYAIFTCIDCHDHNQPDMDDEHSDIGGYIYESIACYECHPTGEGDGGFNHNISNFPLTGAHITTPCSECHISGYQGTPTNCDACHITAYNLTVNPNHINAGIPITCADCHTTNPEWKPAQYPIHDNVYPLTGGHALIAGNCEACHHGNYTTTPNTCVGCHQDNYDQTTNPSHVNLNLPAECNTCHTTNPDWKPATFSIHNEFYVLQGAHAAIAGNCETCHNGDYNNTPNTCVGCHLNDYNQTTNPPHASAQFPTDCELCHTQNNWTPSTFDHDNLYFPIYSGKHEGEWNLCSDCHINPGNYGIFSCIDCHEHNQPEMDDKHSGVAGYQYNSIACYNCHPDGQGGKMHSPMPDRKRE